MADAWSFRRTDYRPRAYQVVLPGLVVEWGRTYTNGRRFFLLRIGRSAL